MDFVQISLSDSIGREDLFLFISYFINKFRFSILSGNYRGEIKVFIMMLTREFQEATIHDFDISGILIACLVAKRKNDNTPEMSHCHNIDKFPCVCQQYSYKCFLLILTNIMDKYMLLFGTRAYLFSPDEGSCYVFSTRNNCWKFLASYDVIFQSSFKLYFKTPV